MKKLLLIPLMALALVLGLDASAYAGTPSQAIYTKSLNDGSGGAPTCGWTIHNVTFSYAINVPDSGAQLGKFYPRSITMSGTSYTGYQNKETVSQTWWDSSGTGNTVYGADHVIWVGGTSPTSWSASFTTSAIYDHWSFNWLDTNPNNVNDTEFCHIEWHRSNLP